VRFFEGVQSAAVLAYIRSRNIDDGIQKRHGFGKDGCDVLTTLVSHLAETGIRVGVDIQRAADDVHEKTISAKGRFVETRVVGIFNIFVFRDRGQKKGRAFARPFVFDGYSPAYAEATAGKQVRA
jgi:hypothetical protein